MKKTYKQPLTEVVKINAEQMICNSPTDVTLNLGESQISSGNDIGSKDDDDDFGDLW